jgi:tripartite-type tricarboxylate transporter receptor subunit TctC
MRMGRLVLWLGLGLGLALATLAPAHVQSQSLAQTWPSKPIRIIVPLTPGSPVDVVARLVGQHWSSALGQPVVIENRPGAGATIGAKAVASADPDGYTLLHTAANHVIAPSAYKNLSYDPIKDFTPIGSTAVMPFVVVIANSVPANTVQELVDYSKANPGKLNFGFGLGTSPHLLGELLKLTTGAKLESIPYKGGAQAVSDILGGQIHMNIGTTATLVPLVQAGRLKAIAVTGATRYPDLPNVPTMSESGYPKLSLGFWAGVLAPAAIPPEVARKLNSTLNAVLVSPEMKVAMAKLGLQPKAVTPQDFTEFLQTEMRDWAAAVEATGVKLD